MRAVEDEDELCPWQQLRRRKWQRRGEAGVVVK